MSQFQRYLAENTYNPAFLWKMVTGILLGGVLVAAGLQLVPQNDRQMPGRDLDLMPGIQDESDRLLVRLSRLLEPPRPDFEKVLDVLRTLPGAPEPLLQRSLERLVDSSAMSDIQKKIVRGQLESLLLGKPAESLLRLSSERPRVRYANRALGDLWQILGDRDQAALAFEEEGEFREASVSRRRAILLYLEGKQFEKLEFLREHDLYQSEFTATFLYRLARARQDWSEIWWRYAAKEIDTVQFKYALLAALAGAAWLAFCLQAAQVRSMLSMRTILCGCAVLLGVLSIIPTISILIWEEETLGFVERNDVAGGLLYFIAGVGLREELCKLLLFLPAVPILLRRGEELEMLMVAGCVGLGFAAAENIHYFETTLGPTVPGRFLTANFFHVAATGLIGLYLCRAIRQRDVALFLNAFLTIVLIHGVYDALIVIPALRDYSFLYMTCYILLCYQFFQELRGLRKERRQTISLTANFLFGLSCLLAVTFVFLSYNVGMGPAANSMVSAVISYAIIAYMFLREMPGSLVS